MRSLSATDNRLPRARPPLRPNALAISDAFMTYILLSAKHKVKQTRTVQLQSSINCERAARPRPKMGDRSSPGALDCRDDRRFDTKGGAYVRSP